MSGLNPFRHIPTTVVEWSKWMRAQDHLFTSTSETETVAVLTTTNLVEIEPTRWVVADFTGDRTLRDEDEGKILRSLSGSATNLTVPKGWLSGGKGQVVIMQYGAGTVTIVAASGVTIDTPSTLIFNEQYGTVTLIQIDNDEYLIAGRMSP